MNSRIPFYVVHFIFLLLPKYNMDSRIPFYVVHKNFLRFKKCSIDSKISFYVVRDIFLKQKTYNTDSKILIHVVRDYFQTKTHIICARFINYALRQHHLHHYFFNIFFSVCNADFIFNKRACFSHIKSVVEKFGVLSFFLMCQEHQ